MIINDRNNGSYKDTLKDKIWFFRVFFVFTDRHTFIHTLHTISTDVVSQNWQKWAVGSEEWKYGWLSQVDIVYLCI